MYCLGDLRSAIFSPRASRSRSRCRIFSRSIATDFIRRASVSVDQKRHRERHDGRDRADRGEQHRHEPGVVKLFDDEIDHGASEVEIDHLAHDHDAGEHPQAQPASIMRPVGWVHSSSMYCGLVM